jgi:penicillin-binding protein 1A
MLSTEQTFERKIQEQYLAIQLEKMIDKDQILEIYLNTAPFGRGTLGVQSAANTYFNKDVSELTIAESAVIASITQYPTKYEPVTNPENNRERQVVVLQKMLDNGMITEEEYEEAYNEDVYANIQIVTQEIADQSDYSYFVDEVIRDVADDLQDEKGYTSTQAYNLIYSGGLSIYITQDTDMQNIVDNVFTSDEYFPSESECYAVRLMYSLSVQTEDGPVHHYKEVQFDTNEEAEAYIEEIKVEWDVAEEDILGETALFIPQPQSAMIIMDYHTGYVKALTGGRGEKIGNQVFNRATQALRQPGSTFKVLAAYLPAIDEFGYTLATVIDDVPFSISMGTGETYQPTNWYRNQTYDYRGLSTVREAIQDSMNVCAVKTLYDIGIDTAFEYLLDLGFTTLADNDVINSQVFTDKTLALALGGLTKGVTLVELNAAYGAIANEGVYIEPIFYTKVLDHDNAILLKNEPITRTVMKETTSFLLTSALKSVVTSGTGTPAYFEGMPIAGKTGTTSDNIDYVFCGFTPYYVASVWMGFDQPESMPGFSYHKQIWKVVMEEIHADLEYKDFPKPSGIVGATICTESGKLATDICSNDPRGSTTRYEYFATGTVPTEECDVHVTANICTESGLIATEYCPTETVQEQVFIVRPEPLIPAEWDPEDPPRIADYQYELPTSMEGEYCNIHGPTFQLPLVDLPGENTSSPAIDTDDNE